MWAEVLPDVPDPQRVGSDHVGELGLRGGGEEAGLVLAAAEVVCVCGASRSCLSRDLPL